MDGGGGRLPVDGNCGRPPADGAAVRLRQTTLEDGPGGRRTATPSSNRRAVGPLRLSESPSTDGRPPRRTSVGSSDASGRPADAAVDVRTRDNLGVGVLVGLGWGALGFFRTRTRGPGLSTAGEQECVDLNGLDEPEFVVGGDYDGPGQQGSRAWGRKGQLRAGERQLRAGEGQLWAGVHLGPSPTDDFHLCRKNIRVDRRDRVIRRPPAHRTRVMVSRGRNG
jgi:hypothetical protein